MLKKYQKNPFAALFQNNYKLADKIPQKFRTILNKLNKGEVSQPFRHKGKYYILKLIDEKQPKVFSFDQVKEKIRKILVNKKSNEIKKSIKNKLLKKYNIKFTDKR